MTFARLCRPLSLFSLAFHLCSLTSAFGQEPLQIKFRVVADNMIVVPLTINGTGQYDFLLDTGTSNTVVDQKLAEELHLPVTGKMILATASGEAVTPVVRANSLSIAGATVHDLNIVAVSHYPHFLPKLRGTVGEDFLRNFDLLIDNRRHLIQFEFGPGPLLERLTGEHLLLSLNGFNERTNQLVVVGNFYENKGMKLQLDSGTPRIVLFSEFNELGVVSRNSQPVFDILGGSFAADEQPTKFLQLGNKRFPELTVIVARGKFPSMDVDGLLPTSLFKSIFISHSGKFVILDPSAKPALVQLKPPETEVSDVQSGRNVSSPFQ